MIKKILLTLLVLLLLLIIIAGSLLYRGINYTQYDVKADPELFPEVRTEDDAELLAGQLLAEMTLEEKLEQMWGERPFMGYVKFLGSFLVRDQFPHIYVGRNERLNIPPWVLSDGPRGAVVGKGNTSFPVAMARAASWDRDLEARVASVVGKELRANGANYNAAPCINTLWHPGWGRAQETYGEDPWLLGEMAVAYTRSVQQHNVMACPKHFALNNIENSRFYVDVTLDERTLREVYLPHFKKVIQEGEAASIMSSYNRVRGEYSSQNHYLLTDILRDDWGFEGFVSTDWILGLHDGVKGVKAGLDVEMPFRNHYGDELEEAIESSEVTEEEIDVIVERILKTRLPYAFADDRMEYDESLKASAEHVALAREVAEKSMVLLKNEQVLPFSDPAGMDVAVMGNIADLPNTGDRGSSHVRNENIVTQYAGIRHYVENRGGEALLYDDFDSETGMYDLDEAAETARQSDQVVLVAGYTHLDEGEYIDMDLSGEPGPPEDTDIDPDEIAGGDRFSLDLKPEDEELIRTVTAENPNTVVVLVAGSAVTMSTWQDDAPAILYSWYAGMEGGHALANVLYGEVNPGGKLPFTIPQHQNQLPPFEPFAESVHYDYYHGYTLFDNSDMEPAYPFGYGMSYTDYAYRDAAVGNANRAAASPALNQQATSTASYQTADSANSNRNDASSYRNRRPLAANFDLSVDDTLTFSVTVENRGDRTGEEIIQLYIGFSNSSVDRPIKLLRGFEKIALEPGEEQRVEMSLPAPDLAWYNPDTGSWEIEPMEYEYYLGPSSDPDELLSGTFTLTD